MPKWLYSGRAGGSVHHATVLAILATEEKNTGTPSGPARREKFFTHHVIYSNSRDNYRAIDFVEALLNYYRSNRIKSHKINKIFIRLKDSMGNVQSNGGKNTGLRSGMLSTRRVQHHSLEAVVPSELGAGRCLSSKN